MKNMDPATIAIISTIFTIVGTIFGVVVAVTQLVDFYHKYQEKQRLKRQASPQFPSLKARSKRAKHPTSRQDWGEAIAAPTFYGRNQEVDQLCAWIRDDYCRMVVILGIGGVGKTTLSIKLGQQIQDQFEVVIWRSLREAPPLGVLLPDVLRAIAHHPDFQAPEDRNAQIVQLLDSFNQARCLLILDNGESIMQGGEQMGEYREGYDGYGELFRRVGGTAHKSCLVVTSRENPKEIAAATRDNPLVRCLPLTGLTVTAAEELFHDRHLIGTEAQQRSLIEFYQGNPLALKIVSTTIQELFDGDIAQFLASNPGVFGDIRDLLAQQCDRLSELERSLLVWLAIHREPVAVATLQEVVNEPTNLLAALQSLVRRCLIEKTATQFTLQPVVMEYFTDQLIQQATDGIADETDKRMEPSVSSVSKSAATFLNRYPLIQATAQDYVREAQERLILDPVAQRLSQHWGGANGVETQLKQILNAQPPRQPGYLGGNVLNLLRQLQVDLSGSDFSHRTIWQAFLQGIELHRVNFAHADFAKSVFTDILNEVRAVAFSPDGNRLATADMEQIRLWQVSDGQPLFNLKNHQNGVDWIAFSSDGQRLATVGFDATIKLWDVSSGELIQTLQGHAGEVTAVLFTSDHKTLISSSHDATIKFWNPDTGECYKTLQGHTHRVQAIALSPSGKMLASGSDNMMVKLWDVQTGKCLNTLQGHTAWVSSVAFSPDGKTLLSGSGDETIRLWDVQRGVCLTTLTGHADWVRAVAFTPQGHLFASSSNDKTIKLWSPQTHQCLKTLKGHEGRVLALAMSPDGQTLASGSGDHTARLWDVNTGRCLKTFQGYTNVVYAVAISPDGALIASGNLNKTIRIWNAHTGECLKTLPKQIAAVNSVAFSSDGLTLASASYEEKGIRLWDISTGQCIQVFSDGDYRVNHVSWNSDSTLLAGAADEALVKLWDVKTGHCILTLENESQGGVTEI